MRVTGGGSGGTGYAIACCGAAIGRATAIPSAPDVGLDCAKHGSAKDAKNANGRKELAGPVSALPQSRRAETGTKRPTIHTVQGCFKQAVIARSEAKRKPRNNHAGLLSCARDDGKRRLLRGRSEEHTSELP